MRHRVKLALGGFATLAAICGVNLLADCNTAAMLNPNALESSEITKVTAPAYLNYGDDSPVVVFHPGDVFFAHTVFDRSLTCEQNAVVNLIGVHNAVTAQLSSAVNWLPEGVFERNERLVIPAATPPGLYHVIKKIINTSKKRAYFTTVFDIRIEVEETLNR